jgi:hypothetical protein
MHATVRHYEGIGDPVELIKQVQATFLPLMKDIPGYVDYYFVDVGEAGGRMVSVSVFETEEGTAESNKRAADWVRDRPGLIPSAKLVEAGKVAVGG